MEQKHIDRFWDKVVRLGKNECWDWNGWHRGTKMAYGGMRVGHKLYLAHRLSWEIHVGPIPENMLVLHRCDNPPCTNPDHLFLGTTLDNVRDKISKGRLRVPHLLIEEDVRRIRESRLFGAKVKDMAHIYNVSLSCIRSVIYKNSWANVE